MLKKTEEGYYILDKLNKPGLVHGFSIRKHGGMSLDKSSEAEKNRTDFLALLGLKKENLVLMEQVHKDKILRVRASDKGGILEGVDGTLTTERGIVLGVRVADCLPILLHDPAREIIGVVHAGWKGVLLEIGAKAIEFMRKMGSSPERILVGIGPHISACCYHIPLERRAAFEKKFGPLPGMIEEANGQFFLNLAIPMIDQLKKEGIRLQNTEVARKCTACFKDEFFSFRRQKGKNGLILGVISLRS